MNLIFAATLMIAAFLTATLSGVFGMVGGMVLLWVLLLLMPVRAALALQGQTRFKLARGVKEQPQYVHCERRTKVQGSRSWERAPRTVHF
ncbi:MAG: hypothetical protein WAO78_15185 [Roseovarius sp.]